MAITTASGYYGTMPTYDLWFYLRADPNSSAMRKTNKGLQIEASNTTEAIMLAHSVMPGYVGKADYARLYDPDGNEITQIVQRHA